MIPKDMQSISPALLHESNAWWGPLTRRRIAWLLTVYGLLLLLGLTLSQITDSPQLQALGMGLMLPGGGFLAYANYTTGHGMFHLMLAVIAMALFVGSIILWFATGNAVAPPLIWLLAALAAGSMNHGAAQAEAGWRIGISISTLLVVGMAISAIRFKLALSKRRAANRYLAEAARHSYTSCDRDDMDLPAEFSLRDLLLMRFVLDRALQPVTEYEGFDWIDQFQTAAVRYQLNFMGYALSMAQSSRLPAFGGYLDDAQGLLLKKQTHHRIWRYWALENLWGNLSHDADPIARENIMYSGFCALQIALFHAASGRKDFAPHHSFALHHPSGRVFAYDYSSLIAVLNNAYRHSPYYLIACEPNWVYPLCNMIGAAALTAHDAQVGSQYWSAHEDVFRQHLEHEFIDPIGRIVPCRSTYTGLALPAIGGALPQALPSFFLNATLPDIALRQWLLLRRNVIETTRRERILNKHHFWPIDTGNYAFSRAGAYAGTALAATEMGDGEVASLCFQALETECPALIERDAMYRPGASVWTHAVELLARSGTKSGFRNLCTQPHKSKNRPHISEARYPEVLVARAVENTGVLSAVLYPGISGGRFQLGVAGLRPKMTYLGDGCVERCVTTDDRGEAKIHVDIDGRKEIRLRPTI